MRIGLMSLRPVFLLASVALCLAATVARGQSAAVIVRGGDHPDFSRIVFDFERIPDYQAVLEDKRLLLRFAGRRSFDFGTLMRDPLARLAAPVVIAGEDHTVVAFAAVPGGMLRQFASDTSLVLDLVDAGARQASPTPAAIPVPAPEAAAAAPVQESVLAPIAPGDATSVRVTASEVAGDLVLDYPFATPPPAAMFERAGVLWVLFERKLAIDHGELDLGPGSPAGARLLSAESLDHPDHSVLRYRLRPGHHLAAVREVGGWRLRISAGETLPRQAIEPIRQQTADGGRLFVEAGEPGARLRIEDPTVGDMLEIVLFGDSGRGLGGNRNFAQFELLASAQGLVVRALADDVRVTRYGNGVAIEGRKGLDLSGPALELAFGGDAAPVRLIDPDAWRGEGDFVEARHRLLGALAAAIPAERNAARWDLARLLIGHGRHGDALGLLQLMAENDPGLKTSAPWLAASGVALLGLGRPQEALLAFLDRSLDTEAGIALWRALAAAAAGRPGDALVYLEGGSESLETASPYFAARLRLMVADAALDTGANDIAAREIAALQAMPLAAGEGLRVDHLYGRLAEARGDMATARVRYQDAAVASDRRLSAQARFDLVKLRLGEGDIDRPAAIEALEALRFAWRGDELERELLHVLADLHAGEGNYRAALETWRLAAGIFTEGPQSRDITSKMTDIFARLFLDGAADRMSPVAALGLYFDFRELTPLGAEGDRMIRRLVDRLVSVDLLDRAAELLQHQVNYRLEGPGQASVAARLGKIYLLDGKAEQALGVLRATRQDGLPDDIGEERRLVETRALIELGRLEEARVLLEDETSREADELRADIFWESRDWTNLAFVSSRLLGERWRDRERPLDIGERRHLVRQAIALSFTDSRAALALLRQRYRTLIATGDYAGLFDVLTSEDPPPAGQLSKIAGELSQASRFRTFLAAYRAEFEPVSATSQATQAGTG